MSVLEKDIEAKVRTWALKHGFLVVKVRFVENGYPDRLFISPKGHTIFIEFKRLGEKPEPIQLYRIRQLQARNIPAYWTDTYVGAITILQTALEPEGIHEESNPPAVVTSIRRAIAGPRSGQDEYNTRHYKDFEGERSDPEGPDYSSAEDNPGDVAQ